MLSFDWREVMSNQIKAMQLLSKKKSTMHLLHLVLSVITVGFWVLPWIIVTLSNSIENAKIDRQINKLQ